MGWGRFCSSWKLPTSLLLLSLVPLVAGGVRLAGLAGGTSGGGVTPENARFMENPAPVVLHVLSASLFCVLGALQFAAALRQRFTRLHRIAGRVAAPCGIVAALTGLWMTAAYAIPAELQGPLLYTVRMVVGLAMALAVIVSIVPCFNAVSTSTGPGWSAPTRWAKAPAHKYSSCCR